MLIDTGDLHKHRGRVSMVDGGFDPLHHGHIEYFEQAAALGLPVLCNLAPDEWVAAKHPVLLTQAQRARVVDAIRFIDFTHLARQATVEVLAELRPRHYVKGSDWEGRLPEAELATCAEHGIEVVYLDAVLDSSSAIVKRMQGGRS
jgi:cytidyltransferase-like protein